ncbi:hypothetical protein P168DRAFT_279911 [Aspergillus campestris IBT 28561]|uniref:Uncharacterized protein n=1 Tax=Aspergillus campestris (strain IBT 28561) TaxID=1392248 RepID=A0A2I1D9D5_ASPC2|nr:uncharacterized protein P168DRAFT_279911 [Aspergillus campestris IBT 28561]PKY06485.1 hypothetical protein P168DRAFT_279911 [Aspergillus campestris IBT 28561]
MLRCDDPTCTCQPAPPKPNRQIQLTLHDASTSKTIAIHHADADLDITFDIINKRLVLQETIYRVLSNTPSSTCGGNGGGKEINTSRTPLPKRPVSWTFTMNFPISTTSNTKNGTKGNTKSKIKNKNKNKSSNNSSGGTTLHFANLIGLNDNSLLLTLTLQTTPSSGETGTGGKVPKVHTKERINNFNTTLEKSNLQEGLYLPLLHAAQQHHQHQHQHQQKESKGRKVQMQIMLPAERLHSWRTVALIVRTFRRVSAEQWCQLIHLKPEPRPPGLGGLDWRGVEDLVLASSVSSGSSSSLSGDWGGEGDRDGRKEKMTTRKKKKEPNKKKKKTVEKKAEKKKIPWGEQKKEERLPEDVDDPVIGVGDYIIFRELYTW